jgi:hypothetical protein
LDEPLVPSTHITTQAVPLTVAPAPGWVMKTFSAPLEVAGGVEVGGVVGGGVEAGGVVVGGGVVVLPVAEALMPRDTVSPSAVKVTLPAKDPAEVGWKRTTTFCWAPGASVNDAPDATRKGAPTPTDPVTGASLELRTVKVRSTVVPVAALPKLTAVVGVTLRSDVATPVATGEQALSLPD